MIILTEKAGNKILELQAADESLKDKRFRVKILAGGCSGFSYDFSFGNKEENDSELLFGESGKVKVIVDAQSAFYLGGGVLDYRDGLTNAGFFIENPKATGGCGCGQSFSFD